MGMNGIMQLMTAAPLAATARDWDVQSLAQRVGDALPSHPWQALGFFVLALGSIGALVALLGMGLIYAERKIAAHFQCRLGPMRVGWHGLLQTVADTLKLLLKEDIVPIRANQWLHFGAPFLSLLSTLLVLAVIPFSPWWQVADVEVGVVFVVAASGLGTIGVLLAGWSSNNKWSLLGAMRAGAQIISYEVSTILALLVVVMFAGTLQLSEIVKSQDAGWWVWRAHGVGALAFLIYLIASVAEINRTPFDISEGESELTAGFHTEYSGIRFAFFFLAEFVNMFVVSALAATLFLGGWMPFHIGDWAALNRVMDFIPPALWFWGKTGFIIFLIMWFRWTFPRLRVDQLMRLEWKFLVPIGFINLAVAAVVAFLRFYPFATAVHGP
jgi:NADH-quinone oxidoreductase subunit H